MREKDYTGEWCYTTHLLIREYFYNQLNTCPELRKQDQSPTTRFCFGKFIRRTSRKA